MKNKKIEAYNEGKLHEPLKPKTLGYGEVTEEEKKLADSMKKEVLSKMKINKKHS